MRAPAPQGKSMQGVLAMEAARRSGGDRQYSWAASGGRDNSSRGNLLLATGVIVTLCLSVAGEGGVADNGGQAVGGWVVGSEWVVKRKKAT